MSRELPAGPPLALFGDLDQGIWGIAIGGAQPQLAIGGLNPPPGPDPDAPAFVPAEWSADERGPVTVRAGATSLTLIPAQEAVTAPGGEADLSLCQITGTAALGGETRELTLSGLVSHGLPGGKLDSIRVVGAWFPEGHAVALVATRPRGASGPDKDGLTVLAGGEAEEIQIFDPRLSTTYDGAGHTRRVGIELWLGPDEDADLFPRRVAGEAAGEPLISAGRGLVLESRALLCHGRGDEGAGVYVLVRAG